MCSHIPRCPTVDASDRCSARVVVDHYEQGWSLLCNGVVLFTDNGVLLPSSQVIAPPAMSRNIRISETV